MPTAFDRPGGRPFPWREMGEAVRINRAEFDSLRELHAARYESAFGPSN